MKTKRLLIILLTVACVIYGVFVVRVALNAPDAFAIYADPLLWLFGVLAFGLLLIGHYLRSLKFQRLLAGVRDNGVRTQFQALLIGYAFNAVLPFRLGEIVRAIVLGRSIRISTGYMFALIMLERAFDGLILGLIGILLAVTVNLPGTAKATILTLSLGLVVVGLILVAVLAALYYQNRLVLRGWHKLTALLNDRLRNSLRFKMWSVIYGLNQTVSRKVILPYVGRSFVMWVAYLGGLLLLTNYFVSTSLALNAVLGFVAFLGVSIPSGPAFLGSYQAVANPLYLAIVGGSQAFNWLVATWGLLIVPSSLLGVVFLFRHHTQYERLMRGKSFDALYDKLDRNYDISQEFEAFLDAYFRQNTLSHILHRLETRQGINLIKYFKGGSNASTLLVRQGGKYVVKKITPIQFAGRLRAQYDWLKERENLSQIVDVTSEQTGSDFYSIDIAYHDHLEPYFDYLHSHDIKRSRTVLRGIFTYLFDNVYRLGPMIDHTAELEAYIANKFTGKLEQASRLNLELAKLRSYDKLMINGEEYDNAHVVMDKIRHEPKIWHDLTHYRQSPIHGDTQVDNMLVSKLDHSFMIIDPVDQNEVESPVVDFGRMYQSLGYGYEFLCRDDAPVTPEGNSISYEDSLSASYNQLYETIRELAAELLEPGEYRSVLFHTAVHYSRMTTHRVEINADNVAKFYAVSVRAFNDFYAQYNQDTTKTKASSKASRA